MAGTSFINGAFMADAYESITVAATAIGFTAGTIKKNKTTLAPADINQYAHEAYLTLETAQVRWRMDGTDPTASEGHIMEVGDTLIIDGYQNLAKFRAIRTGGTSGVLKATYLIK